VRAKKAQQTLKRAKCELLPFSSGRSIRHGSLRMTPKYLIFVNILVISFSAGQTIQVDVTMNTDLLGKQRNRKLLRFIHKTVTELNWIEIQKTYHTGIKNVRKYTSNYVLNAILENRALTSRLEDRLSDSMNLVRLPINPYGGCNIIAISDVRSQYRFDHLQ
jgi:hypothetical protein